MNGAGAVLRTLADSGVSLCLANPGTSEMHMVAALDEVPQMRAVLCLFEGAATGAADGYGRMTGRPAAVLLHLGPGLANGLANLHNARRARTPLLAIVGDHATYHKRFDAPLESDIDALTGWLDHGSLFIGRGLGGIGFPQLGVEWWRYNAADNLMIYLLVSFGLLALGAMTLTSDVPSGRTGDENIRELLVGAWRLIYHLNPGVVSILGLIHGARDLSALWEREGR